MTEFWDLLRAWGDTAVEGTSLNASQMAEVIGTSSQNVSKWSRGTIPKPDMLRQVAQRTGLDWATVLRPAVLRDLDLDETSDRALSERDLPIQKRPSQKPHKRTPAPSRKKKTG